MHKKVIIDNRFCYAAGICYNQPMAKLKLVATNRTPEPWEQRPNEPADCFCAFCEWLWNMPRSVPPEELADIVSEWGWAQRAEAWDAFAANAGSDRDMLAQLERDLLVWAANGAKAMARSKVPAAPRDVLAGAAYLTSNSETLTKLLGVAERENIDLSTLSDEELAVLVSIQQKLG